MYVVFELNGRQYDGFIGQKVTVDLLSASDKTAKIDKVLLVKKSGQDILVGKPYVSGAEISADIKGTFKDAKVVVFKYKKRKKFRKKRGHRQQYTEIFLNSLKTPGFSIDAATIEEARKAEARKWHEHNKKNKPADKPAVPAAAQASSSAQTGSRHEHASTQTHRHVKGHKKT